MRKIAISLEGLCDVLRGKSSHADISPQALSEKTNSDHAKEGESRETIPGFMKISSW